ncbi:hypothetical protein DRJ25_04860, partial [Candidatus Woesearchaeota archaeon]
AIALLVLVILSVVFLGNMKKTTTTISNCPSGSEIMSKADCATKGTVLTQYNVDDPDSPEVEICCAVGIS